jgi:hypothetical protein
MEELWLIATIPISPSETWSDPLSAGANGGADPTPINDGNQSPRHTQGGEGGRGSGSSLQGTDVMAAAMNNNEGIYLYSTQ